MAKKRIFVSGRLEEMGEFREAAKISIRQAGMEPVFFETTVKPVDLLLQFEEAIKSSDAFVGIYGNTLNTNFVPEGKTKHFLELEYEFAQAAGLPCICYVSSTEHRCDESMVKFRRQVMKKGVGFISTPDVLSRDLLEQLKRLKPRIFISYSSKDQNFVVQLHERLKASGQSAWLNTESIEKGAGWYDQMTDGLANTDILILVLSPDSVESKWVRQEWQSFLKTQKTILPVLCRECKVPRKIKALQIINTKEEDRWYLDLLKAIESN